MAKRMSDDEIADAAYRRIFGDLDGIRAGSMFGGDEDDVEGAAPHAGKPGIEGVSIEVKPLMAAAEEGGKPDDIAGDEEDEDRLKGIGAMSPLMEQLHGRR